jgi:hypothetical protein
MPMRPLDIETAKAIIDFSGGQESLEELGNLQLEGAVALHNMISDPDVGLGYLADEVGMGKTYIALGVVALMRFFNPSLRVLYICPSRNVQEKWHREYLSFIKHNVKGSQFLIRTAEGKPAAPYINCRNVPELIRMAAIGYFADFFVGKDSFSISLSNDEDTWKNKCRDIQSLLPAHEWNGIVKDKQDVKDRYAAALNYILPTFDLVVIDEAHNFKHDLNSSDRNRVLSNVLGFTESFQPRIKNALLLSATPYDRNLQQLRNQLILVGKSNLLPDDIKNENKHAVIQKLSQFMVRRLNCIQVNGKPHTRNMYRQEHRAGEKAEVTLKSDEQKLVTALVQKKVGEMMSRSGSNPAFQIGMMASFESYAQTAKAEPVQFDDDTADKEQNDAQDRHVVMHIVDSYKRAELGKTLPHPKMDTVCNQLQTLLFSEGKKQLVFVRRVKSVKEIKNKLDDHYNTWLEAYIKEQLADNLHLQTLFSKLFEQYRKESLYKNADISEGIFTQGLDGDTEDNQPPVNDTFFTWFFRGSINSNAQTILVQESKSSITPEALRKGLTAKNQSISLMLELNWARYIAGQESVNLADLVAVNEKAILEKANKYAVSQLQDDKLDIYRACQLGFLEWYGDFYKTKQFQPLLKAMSPQLTANRENSEERVSASDIKDNLLLDTLYTLMQSENLVEDICPLQAQVYQNLKRGSWDKHLFDKLDVHCHLISLSLRTGHGIIDLYLSRLRQGSSNLTAETRVLWIKDLINSLKKQKESFQFSTYSELSALSENLDLVIKVNIPEVFDSPNESRRIFISHRLNPVSPVIGATGETSGSRSAQARKFRMPGYPLALISTNVFQEGEDLHTFCDSVVHYGLSGSPISIEQKTGRVDRVNSIVHRRFSTHNSSNTVTVEGDFIQVTFPYIKESIELLQVRQLCQNINGFIESLHELDKPAVEKQDIVNTEQAIKDKSDIPEQIRSFLKSPYVPNISRELSESLISLIEIQQNQIKEIVEHVESLVKQTCGYKIFEEGLTFPDSEISKLNVRLNSARSSGELLLIAEADNDEYRLSQGNILETLRETSWNTFHRTQAIETASDCYKLTINAEMLVGDALITQPEEIKNFFGCFNQIFSSDRWIRPESEIIKRFCKKIATQQLSHNNKKLDARVNTEIHDEYIELKFKFGDVNLGRNQSVRLYEVDGLCVFLSKAITLHKLESMEGERDRKTIEYTWVRNNYVDVVEFLLDPDGDISGRIIHPINNMSWEEFLYNAYMLATEADRLEYIADQKDVL